MMRYRPASKRPGRNRPSVNKPPEELETLTEPEAALADALGFESTNSMVASSSPDTIAAPQDKQKRPLSGTCEPHDTHVAINLSA
jgi:hypothetical protein